MPRAAASRTEVLHLIANVLGRDDRVLVTGGSGWLGRTTIALVWQVFGPQWVQSNLRATASRERVIDLLGYGPVRVHDRRGDFWPTVLVNCAFPTRDRVEGMGHGNYVSTASRLTQQLLKQLTLPELRKAVTFSSGAAVASDKFPADLLRNPYGVLKAAEEQGMLDVTRQTGVTGTVCRVWAISGPHVLEPAKYAVSDFVEQGLRNAVIEVRAAHPVIRQYASADDVVAVSLAADGVFDSGGETAELGYVARLVADSTDAIVHRARYDAAARPDDYRGDDRRWIEILGNVGLQQEGLVSQVDSLVSGLRA